MARLDEPEHVATDEHVVWCADFRDALLDEAGVVAVFLHADHPPAAAREQLQRDAACARKEVEGGRVVQVEVAPDDVEDVLLGEVGRRPRLECAGNLEMTTLIDTSDDAHDEFV